MFRLLLLVFVVAAKSAVAAAPWTDPRAVMLALLLPDQHTPLEEREFAVKPWTHGPEPNLWVAAILLRDQSGGNLVVGVFRNSRDSLVPLARSDNEPDTDEPLWNAAIGLDLIPYRIRPNETAFGVTVENSYASTARSSGSQSLQLYRYRGKKLSPIFSAIVSRNNFDRVSADECEVKKVAQDCGEQSTTAEDFVVSFSPHRTRGFFDLLLRPKRGGKAERYAWTGDKYEKADEKAQ